MLLYYLYDINHINNNYKRIKNILTCILLKLHYLVKLYLYHFTKKKSIFTYILVTQRTI